MNILGINFIFHDTSACIVSGGELLVALEEERLTGAKHTQQFPIQAINRCLEMTNLDPSQIDHIAVSINPIKHVGKKLCYALSLSKDALPFINYEFLRVYSRKRTLWQWYKSVWSGQSKRPKLHFIEHHLSHVGGSYFVSPFEKAALLSLDGWGEWTTTWLGYADGLNITRFQESRFPHSLGCFYSAATEFCGFKPNYDEGKTMGLAPMGNPERFYSQVEKMIEINHEGRVKIDLSYFKYQNACGKLCGQKFHDTFGSPRKNKKEFQPHHMNVAAAFQKVLEEKILQLCRILETKTKADYLVLAGGGGA